MFDEYNYSPLTITHRVDEEEENNSRNKIKTVPTTMWAEEGEQEHGEK